MKLPITPLLYLVSTACLAGIVHSVYAYTKNKDKLVYPSEKIRKTNASLKKQAKDSGASDEVWNYGVAGFWTKFTDANFTGKVEVDPTVLGKTTDQPEVPAPSDIPDLSKIFQILCITNAGKDTCVVIQYDQGAEVEVPEGQAATPSAPILNTMPKGRRPGGDMPMSSPAVSKFPPDQVKVGESLWKKYEHIVLKSVDENARYATFEIRIDAKKDKDGKFPTQEVHKPALGLSQEILILMKDIRDGKVKTGQVGSIRRNTVAGGTTTAPKPKKNGDTPQDQWVDVKDTYVDRAGKANVSRKDQRWLEDSGSKIFDSDVNVGNYSGGTGKNKIRGVEIRKVSSRVRRFGIDQGDVIISLNGQKVTGMAHAKKVGRRLYQKQGVRSFRAEILRAGQVIERTYTFKK